MFKDHGLSLVLGVWETIFLGPWVIISRMFFNDNILVDSKRNIVDNFPIESTYPTVFYPWWEFRVPEHSYGLLLISLWQCLPWSADLINIKWVSIYPQSRKRKEENNEREDFFEREIVVYYESRKRELQIRLINERVGTMRLWSRNREVKTRFIYEDRCDETLKN